MADVFARRMCATWLCLWSLGCSQRNTSSVSPTPDRVLAALMAEPSGLRDGYPGMKTTQTVRINAVDDKGMPLPGVSVAVIGDDNGGWGFPSQVTTGVDGAATFSWVPGSLGTGLLTATGRFGAVTKTAMVSTQSINPPTLPLSALNLFLPSPRASGYAIDLTPLTDPRGTYYAALVWHGGYTGLQRDGSLHHDQLQFSVWDDQSGRAQLVNAGAGLTCVAFGNEGSGQACSMSYPWNPGTTYRFEMETAVALDGRNITLHVTNMTTAEKTFIGTLFQPGAADLTYLNSFVEQFHRVHQNCLEQPLRAYAVRHAMARVNDSWQPLTSCQRRSKI